MKSKLIGANFYRSPTDAQVCATARHSARISNSPHTGWVVRQNCSKLVHRFTKGIPVALESLGNQSLGWFSSGLGFFATTMRWSTSARQDSRLFFEATPQIRCTKPASISLI